MALQKDEVVLIKFLAQGHKCHGLELNPGFQILHFHVSLYTN